MLASYAASVGGRKYIKLLVIHLFFSELGNVVWCTENVVIHSGWAPRSPRIALATSLWLLADRVAWTAFILASVHRPMLGRAWLGRRWGPLDYAAFFSSALLCFGTLVFAGLFLYHEVLKPAWPAASAGGVAAAGAASVRARG